MEKDLIIKELYLHKGKIIDELSKDNWRHFGLYFKISDKYNKKEIDEDFKKTFCNFYILNGARGLSLNQKQVFFKILKSEESDLSSILKKLYEIPGYKNSHKLFLSFSTKMLHTKNNNLPIYDSNIADMLSLPDGKSSGDLEEKIINRIKIYEELQEDFKELLSDKKIKDYFEEIRSRLKEKAKKEEFQWEDRFLSDVKLLDSIIWSLFIVKQ